MASTPEVPHTAQAAGSPVVSATKTPAPPSRLPPQKASAFSRAINPLRALSPMVNLIRGPSVDKNAANTPRAPQPSSASAPTLPVVKPPPTPPPARSNSRSRPTPRKNSGSSTPGDASPSLPAVSASPCRPGSSANTPRDSPTPEVSDSPVPRREKEIRPPSNPVARSAPAAPGAPPGAPVGGGRDPGMNGQCREMLQVQGNALRLLNEIFDFPVNEEASVSLLDQYPELAWLAQCMQRCPLPPCWTSVEGDVGGEARFVDMVTGNLSDVQPMLKNFSELARLMLEWRQAPSAAPHVSAELLSRHDCAVEEAARSRRVWTGPHVDQSTGSKFWHCEATGRSTWGDPGAASEFIARVSERLRRALPSDAESPTASAPAVTSQTQSFSADAPAAAVPVDNIAEAAEVVPKRPSSRSSRSGAATESPRPSSRSGVAAEKSRPASRNGAASESPKRPSSRSGVVTESPRPRSRSGVAVDPSRPSSRSGVPLEKVASPEPSVPADELADEPPAKPEDSPVCSKNNKLGDTGEMIRARQDEVRQMFAKISKECNSTRSGETLIPGEPLNSKAPDMSSLPSPARAPSGAPSPRLPNSRGPSPRPSRPSPRPSPSPRTLAAARGSKVPTDANLWEWGVAGNHVYKEAAAEVHAPKIGAFKPGSCRPNASAGARRRSFDSSEKLEPLAAPNSARTPRKQVTLLSQDGVTTVRPGADTPENQGPLFIDGSGAVAMGSPPGDEDIVEATRKTLPPRMGTPGRPRSRRGSDSDEQSGPETPKRPRTPAQVPGTPRHDKTGKSPGTPRPRTPASKKSGLGSDDDVNVASPGRTACTSAVDTSSDSSSSSDAEVVEMACDSPLGNTGCAKELCNLAIAAAVDLAFAEPDATGNVNTDADEAALQKTDTGFVAGISGAAVTYDSAQAADGGSSGSLDSLGAGTEPFANTANFATTLNNTLGMTGGLGNTAAARQLCDDAISAAVGSAVDGLAWNLGGSSGSIDDLGGTVMTLGGTGRATLAASAAFGGTGKATMGGTGKATMGGSMAFAAETGKFGASAALGGTGKATIGGSSALGETGKATMGVSMAGTLAMTLGATGDIPPVAPGDSFPGDDSLPSTPTPQGVETMLRGALASASEDDEENEQVSMSLMSICRPFSPSPTKRDMNASLGDSPSIILLDDTHWTPCKPLSRPMSPEPCPTSPKAPCRRSISKSDPCRRSISKSDRPVKCGSPQPLSARGRERHCAEMAALGLPGDEQRSARGGRPRGRGVRHVAVAGGA